MSRSFLTPNADPAAIAGTIRTVPAIIPPPTIAPSAAKPDVIPAALNPTTEPEAAIAPIGTPTPTSFYALSFMTRLNFSEFGGISFIFATFS